MRRQKYKQRIRLPRPLIAPHQAKFRVDYGAVGHGSNVMVYLSYGLAGPLSEPIVSFRINGYNWSRYFPWTEKDSTWRFHPVAKVFRVFDRRLALKMSNGNKGCWGQPVLTVPANKLTMEPIKFADHWVSDRSLMLPGFSPTDILSDWHFIIGASMVHIYAPVNIGFDLDHALGMRIPGEVDLPMLVARTETDLPSVIEDHEDQGWALPVERRSSSQDNDETPESRRARL